MIEGLIKSSFKAYKTAHVVDGKLILSFPKAKNPIIWQMDLGNIKISALEIQPTEEGPALVLKNPKGEVVNIAVFENELDAVENLVEISNVLGRSSGRMYDMTTGAKSVEGVSHGKKACLWKKVLMILGGLFLIFFVLSLFRGQSVRQASTAQGAGQAALQQAAPVQDGVPLSADDFLMGR